MTNPVSARPLGFALFVALGTLLTSALAHAQSATVSTLMYFNGSRPAGGLTLGADGALYGIGLESTFGSGATAGLIFRLTTDASRVDTIYQYGLLGNYTGGGPRGILARDPAGNLYGVTNYDRLDATTGVPFGAGTVFKISPDGRTYTQLHVFPLTLDTVAPFRNSDGIAPIGSILLASDGFLYGTTTIGGANGAGTIFKLATDGSNFTVLHHFDLGTTLNVDNHLINNDGAQPGTRLLLASNGDLYGTTLYGGINGTGVIYRLHRDGGGFTVLFNFGVSPPLDTTTGTLQTNATGAYPSSGLVQASDGLLYGSAQLQGANGYGTLYRIAPDGGNFTVVQNFTSANGADPVGELLVASDGTIMGTTSAGATLTDGTTPGVGTLYSLNIAGATTLNTLFVFGVVNDGSGPTGGVVQASDGNFYGVTSSGSPYGLGTVFKYGAASTAVPQGNPPPINNGGVVEIWLIGLLMTLVSWQLARNKRERRTQP